MNVPGRPSTAAVVSLGAVAVAVAIGARQYAGADAVAAATLLTAGLFGLGVSLGAAFVSATCVVTSARWWLPIRRVPAALAAMLPLPLLVIAVVQIFGRGALYAWTRPDAVATSALLQAKSAWLDGSFFLLRALVIMLVWLGTVSLLARHLDGATAAAGTAERKSLARAAIAFILLLAPTLSVASWDWVMSLEAEWFSTMFGVYVFSGFFLTGLAATAVLSCLPGAVPGLLGGDPGPDVRHDLGKLLFAFACFWAYIWFCQYMLIWYANIPEEATYFVLREAPAWASLFWLVPVLTFVVPFIALMSQRAKRDPGILLQVSLVVLAGRWLDLCVMVLPPTGASATFPWLALLATAGLVLLMVGTLRVRPSSRDALAKPAV